MSDSQKIQINKLLLPFYQEHKRIKIIFGGRGCVTADTLIDTPNGQIRFDEFNGGMVYVMTNRGLDISYAEKPVSYTLEKIYQVSLSNGTHIKCTDEHRFLTKSGWRTCKELYEKPEAIMTSGHKLNKNKKMTVENIANTLFSYLYNFAIYYRKKLHSDSFLFNYSQVINLLSNKDIFIHFITMHDGFDIFEILNIDLFIQRMKNFLSLLYMSEDMFKARGSAVYSKYRRLVGAIDDALYGYTKNHNKALLVHKFSIFLKEFCYDDDLTFANFKFLNLLANTIVDDDKYSEKLNETLFQTFQPVLDITELEPEVYWDMFVPLYNNYLSNNIVNHNSGKSQGIADIMLLFAGQGNKIACFREFQNSIKDSVYSLMLEEIERLGLQGFSVVDNEIRHVSGGLIVFKGLARNIESIKSMSSFRIAWVEEAQTISEESLRQLTPTFRSQNAEIWFSANPRRASDPFSQRFIERKMDRAEGSLIEYDSLHMRLRLNYTDNPWFPLSLESERLDDFAMLDRALYDHIWLGHYNDSIADSIIKAEYVDAALGLQERLGYKDFGLVSVGHDPADSGDARGTIVKRGNVILDLFEDTTNDINNACYKSCQIAKDYSASSYIYDADGAGLGLRAQVRDFFGEEFPIYQFRGNSTPEFPETVIDKDSTGRPITNKSFYRNLRAQMYQELANRFEKTYKVVHHKEYIDPTELISIHPDMPKFQELKSELTSIPRQYNSTGLYQIMSKKDMMTKLKLQSPNLADALMMLMISQRTKKRFRSQLDPGITCV